MLLGISHLCLPVRDSQRARAFWIDAVGLSPQAPGTEDAPYLDLDANGTILRLEQTTAKIRPLRLRLQTSRIEQAIDQLTRAGGTLIHPPRANPALELSAEIADPDGHRLELWRRLSEDELTTTPEIPTEIAWDSTAADLLQSLLRRVPSLFRDLARRGAASEAEYLARQDKEERDCDDAQVNVEHAIRAYIRSTPRLMRERARGPLLDHGIDPELYTEDFDC